MINKNNRVKVLVVDDHPFIRATVKRILEEGNYSVVAEAGSGIEALNLAKQHAPELIVLDISMPNLDGLTIIGRLIDTLVKPKVLILTSMAEEHYVLRCMRAGAAGYVSKKNEIDTLLRAADTVMSGYTFFPLEFIHLMHEKDLSSSEDFVDEYSLISKLSPREITVLKKLASGLTIGAIAEELMLSSKTVSTYKARLFEKLNVNSIVHLSELARRNNL